MSDENDLLVRMFRQFADHEFRGESPLYQRLASLCADDLRLADPLRAAPPRQRRALLLFAGVQYLLRTVEPEHALAGYFPTLGGTATAEDALAGTFGGFVATHHDRLAAICANRRTQTNEARRSALLRPALALAAGDRPLGLIELGTSAGLLLLPDRYAYRYGETDPVGRTDAPTHLVMRCEVRGGQWPDPAMGPTPAVASRTGIDLSPVDPGDPDAVDWLRSCVWPEHVGRLARLDAALAEARSVRPRLVTGDMVSSLPAAVSDVDSHAVPVVFASHAITYLPGALQRELVAVLAGIGAERDLVLILNEAATSGIQLVSADAPAAAEAQAVSTLTLVRWRAGTPNVTALAHTAPHGAWLSWHPREYPYQPKESPGPRRYP